MAIPAPAGASLGRGAAINTLATAASRATGFVRVVVVAAALGTTFLANTYQTANTAPNVLFELFAAGVLTSVFVPTFVEHIVQGRADEGWRVGNVLGSVALAGLVALALGLALLAPVVMRGLTLGVHDATLREQEIALGTALLRLFAPQVVFYGAGMILTAALHAHRRFGIAAFAPVFNNVVVIGAYATFMFMRGDRPPSLARVTAGETLVLGLGTTLGVVAMTLCLVPPLMRLGWRFRWSFAPRHPAVRRAARLGIWALGYAGGYQLGLVVVLLLANRVEGGVAAYQWAYTFFYVPHALFGMPLFNVLFPAMSEHVAKGDIDAFSRRLRDGLAMLAFVLVPVGAALAIVAEPLARVVLQFGAMTNEGAVLVGRVLAAFAVGLPTYSAFLALTRAFYAYGDTKTPALVNGAGIGVSALSGAALFSLAPRGWSVAGLALGHSLGFALAALLAARRLTRAGARFHLEGLGRVVLRSLGVGALATLGMLAAHSVIASTTLAGAAANVCLTLAVGCALYLMLMARMRSRELARISSLLGRARA